MVVKVRSLACVGEELIVPIHRLHHKLASAQGLVKIKKLINYKITSSRF